MPDSRESADQLGLQFLMSEVVPTESHVHWRPKLQS
jgi:hypothetical protein